MAKKGDDVAALTVTDIGPDRLDELRELWLALHRYHGVIGLRLYQSRGFVPREVVLYRLGSTEEP